MKNNLTTRITVIGLLLAAMSAPRAQTSEESGEARRSREILAAATKEQSPAEKLNRLSLAYRLGFDISAKFKGLGGFSTSSSPGPATGGGISRFYDDGYNKVDITGNNHGPGFENTTWNWGFDNNLVLPQLPGNDTIVMHSSVGLADGSLASSDNRPAQGCELVYDRILGRIGKASWGLEAGIGFNQISLANRGTTFASVSLLSDAYRLFGVVPPIDGNQGYHGDYAGPGPVIAASPTTDGTENGTTTRTITTINGAQAISGNYHIDAQIFALQVGPYFELPLGEKVFVSASGGFAAVRVDSKFDFNETTSIAGVSGTQSHTGSGRAGEFLYGGYAGGKVSYKMSDAVNVFAGAKWQDAGTYTHNLAGKRAEINVGGTVYFTAGVGFNF